MAKIVSVNAGLYRLQLKSPVSDAMHGIVNAFYINTVRIMDADGVEALGYTYTPERNGLAIHVTAAKEMSGDLIGCDADGIEAIWKKLWWHSHFGGRGGAAHFALSMIDIALWDLKAKRANVPLWKLLGGANASAPVYIGAMDLENPLDQVLAQTEINLQRGFSAIKMKVGRPRLREDIERVSAVRKLIGDDFPLMVDANMAWTVDAAIRASRSLADCNLTWIEEPIDPCDLAGHARVLRDGGVAIAAGENVRTLAEFRHLLCADGLSFAEPDVTNCGGVTGFSKIAHLAEAFNIPVTSHGAQDISVHLLSALPNASYLEFHDFGLQRYQVDPLVPGNGLLTASERAGHGVSFDWSALKELQVS